MIHKNCDAKIPKPNVYTDDDKKLLDHAHNRLIRPVMEEVDNMRFHRALEKIWRLVNDANIYVDTQAPWALKKEDPERMNTVLYVLAEVIRVLGIATSAVTPESSAKILDQIKIPEDERHFGMINDEYSLPSDFEIDKPEGIFPRLDEAEKAA